MSISIQPRTRLAAALLATGVVAAGPASITNLPQSPPLVTNLTVQPASIVTDVLYGFGQAASAVADAFAVGTDFALGLNYYWDDSDFGEGVPINPVSAVIAALQDPASTFSYLAQLYLNPSEGYAYYTYPWYAKVAVIEPLLEILPTALSTPLVDLVNGIADGIGGALQNLPDPSAAVNILASQYSTTIGRLVYAAQSAIALPVTLGVAFTYWASYLPATLEASLESAIQNPSDIPGLLSNIVYDALDPNLYDGLLGNISYNLAKPFFYLPAPIGESAPGAQDGLAYSLYSGFTQAVDSLLSLLPSPVQPTPFAAVSPPPATAIANDNALPTVNEPATVATADVPNVETTSPVDTDAEAASDSSAQGAVSTDVTASGIRQDAEMAPEQRVSATVAPKSSRGKAGGAEVDSADSSANVGPSESSAGRSARKGRASHDSAA